MSEQYLPPTIATQEYEDIVDSLKLAFFSEPLEPCEVTDLQFSPKKGDTWVNCKKRSKTDYDPSRGCPVIATHYTYDCLMEDATEHRDVLVVEWDDENETNILLYLHNSSMGSYIYENSEYKGYIDYDNDEDIRVQRIQMKMGLAAVTSL